jgi:hypothetical protein
MVRFCTVTMRIVRVFRGFSNLSNAPGWLKRLVYSHAFPHVGNPRKLSSSEADPEWGVWLRGLAYNVEPLEE